MKKESKKIIENNVVIVNEIKKKAYEYDNKYKLYSEIKKKKQKKGIKDYVRDFKKDATGLYALTKKYKIPKELDERTKELLKKNFLAIQRHMIKSLSFIKVARFGEEAEIGYGFINNFSAVNKFTYRLIEYLNEVLDYGRIKE